MPKTNLHEFVVDQLTADTLKRVMLVFASWQFTGSVSVICMEKCVFVEKYTWCSDMFKHGIFLPQSGKYCFVSVKTTNL